MSDTKPVNGALEADIEQKMKELAAALEARNENRILLAERKLSKCLTESFPDMRYQFPGMEAVYKFCNLEPTNNQTMDNDDNTSITQAENFTMDDARQVVEETTRLWPSIEDVTVDRVYALKKMLDADVKANPETSRNQIEYHLIGVIISEGMHRIAAAERKKPVDELSDTEKQNLVREVIGIAKRANTTTAVHSIAPRLATRPAVQGRAIQLLIVIREDLRNIVRNINTMVQEIKEYSGAAALEPLTPAQSSKTSASYVTTADARLVFLEVLKREYLKLNQLYEKHSSEPIGHLVEILDALKLEDMPELDGVSDISDGKGDSEADDPLRNWSESSAKHIEDA